MDQNRQETRRRSVGVGSPVNHVSQLIHRHGKRLTEFGPLQSCVDANRSVTAVQQRLNLGTKVVGVVGLVVASQLVLRDGLKKQRSANVGEYFA